MNVIIAGDFRFPVGLGSTSRVHAYARGFLDNGANVKVLCVRPREPTSGPIINRRPIGTHNGIEFRYTCGSTTASRDSVKRQWMRLIRPVLFLKGLWDEDRKRHIDTVILVSNSPLNMLIVFLLSRCLGFTYVQEKSELPFVYRKKTLGTRLFTWLFAGTMYRLPDAIIVISRYLENYFASRIRRKAQLIHIPILVNTERFAGTPARPPSGRDYIAYGGSLKESKGVRDLIQAFAIIAEDFPDIHLRISGPSSSTKRARSVQQLVGSLDLDERVHLVGTVPFQDYPDFLKGAIVLVVPHRAGEFSEAAFPTKLGEYLATGVPVVASRVGELEDYLTTVVNAYLVSPDDAHALAEQLRFVLTHPDEAQDVGMRGRATAVRHFDYRAQTKRLLAEIRELQSR